MKPSKTIDSATVAIVVILANALSTFGYKASKKVVKAKGDFEEDSVKYASKCEVCKIVTSEIQYQLNSPKFNSLEMIETGYNYMQNSNKHRKQTSYQTSLIRLQEVVESTCIAMLEYNLYKERTDSTRFEKGQTIKSSHGLKNKKGVKEDPKKQDKILDRSSAEITQLKSQCETFVELNEDAIEKWYRKGSQGDLGEHVCKSILSKKDQKCLAEKPVPIQHVKKTTTTNKPKKSEL